METLIEVEHLSRTYGNLLAVNSIQFTLERGQVLGFLGPNGAGKSTTMQMITGNLAPSQGRINICGIDLLEHPKAAKAKIGYLPEQPPVYKEFKVDEYLTFCARINRIAKNKISEAVSNAKQRCGLDKVGHRLIGNLSKGYQQRVGIAQAIIHSPAIIVLDEPTVGLDPIQIREIRSLIRELGNEHGVILSTHILPEAQMTCDHVQIIKNGEFVFQDTIENLNLQTKGTNLILGLSRPPQEQELTQLPGVTSVDNLGHQRWRLILQQQDNITEQIAKKVVEKNWGLIEMTPEHKTLEQFFVDITMTEQIDAPDEADVTEETPA